MRAMPSADHRRPARVRLRDPAMPFFLEKFNTPEKTAWQYAYSIDWEAAA